MEKLNVLPGEQSAYREFYSTETALCSIASDLLKVNMLFFVQISLNLTIIIILINDIGFWP